MPVSSKPDASAALKVKLGRVDTARRCVAGALDGAAFKCIETGLLPVLLEARGSAGKEKSGFGIISMTGA